jgi:hypothetical protein
MALLADQMTPVGGGDQAFYRVDTRRAPHELEAGVAADAVNCRFEAGQAWPRYGVAQQPWGTVPLAAGETVLGCARFNDPQGFDTEVVLTDGWRNAVGEDGGRGRCWRIQAGNIPQAVALNGHDLWTVTRAVSCYNGLVLLRQGNERHYFSEAANYAITGSDATAETLSVDTTYLANGLPVKVSGITGASGSYYCRVTASGKISLYDTAAHAAAGGATGRFNVTVNSQTGTLSRLAVDPAANTIQLNAAQNWVSGDKVIFYANGSSYFTGSKAPQNATAYYVKVLAGNLIQLYSESSLATQLLFTACSGQFWLERAAAVPGFYGNVAPPLLAQPNANGGTLWDSGFAGVPSSLIVTGISGGALTVANHRLEPGDAVSTTGLKYTTGTPISGNLYVYPTGPNTVQVYDTLAAALAGGNTGLQALAFSGDGVTPTLTKAGASGLPMPGGREGAYYQNRLIIVNNRDTLLISDALDPLHFTPFTASTANLGESSQITALWPMGTNDAVLILRENELELLNNFSGGPNAWTLTTLTREYGCIAPLSVAQVGADVWFLSRKGVASVSQTANGVLQGVADPVSKPLKKYIDRIDWRNAAQATAVYWNNRYLLAVPLAGQSGPVQNNAVLSHNFLNVGMTRGAQDGVWHLETLQGWEGLWTGAALLPLVFARLNIYGEERVTFVNYAGQVCWLTEDFMDGATPIATTLTTRRFTGDSQSRKLWLTATVNVDSLAPNFTITALFPGVNETQTLVANKTYDPTTYGNYGAGTYDPATATPQTFLAPWRNDYSISAAELLAGIADLHQNHVLPLRMRRQEWGVQLVIANTTGSLRVQAVEVAGVMRETTAAEAV